MENKIVCPCCNYFNFKLILNKNTEQITENIEIFKYNGRVNNQNRYQCKVCWATFSLPLRLPVVEDSDLKQYINMGYPPTILKKFITICKVFFPEIIVEKWKKYNDFNYTYTYFILHKYLNKPKNQSTVNFCKEYNIARETLYKWLKNEEDKAKLISDYTILNQIKNNTKWPNWANILILTKETEQKQIETYDIETNIENQILQIVENNNKYLIKPNKKYWFWFFSWLKENFWYFYENKEDFQKYYKKIGEYLWLIVNWIFSKTFDINIMYLEHIIFNLQWIGIEETLNKNTENALKQTKRDKEDELFNFEKLEKELVKNNITGLNILRFMKNNYSFLIEKYWENIDLSTIKQIQERLNKEISILTETLKFPKNYWLQVKIS